MLIHNHVVIKWHQTTQKLGTCTYRSCSESINPCCHRFWVTVIIIWTISILSLVNFKFNCSVCPFFWKMYLHASTLDLQFRYCCTGDRVWLQEGILNNNSCRRIVTSEFFYFSLSMHENFTVIYAAEWGSQLWTWTTFEPIDVKHCYC